MALSLDDRINTARCLSAILDINAENINSKTKQIEEVVTRIGKTRLDIIHAQAENHLANNQIESCSKTLRKYMTRHSSNYTIIRFIKQIWNRCVAFIFTQTVKNLRINEALQKKTQKLHAVLEKQLEEQIVERDQLIKKNEPLIKNLKSNQKLLRQELQREQNSEKVSSQEFFLWAENKPVLLLCDAPREPTILPASPVGPEQVALAQSQQTPSKKFKQVVEKGLDKAGRAVEKAGRAVEKAWGSMESLFSKLKP